MRFNPFRSRRRWRILGHVPTFETGGVPADSGPQKGLEEINRDFLEEDFRRGTMSDLLLRGHNAERACQSHRE
jgi:hypothetical protein